MNESEFQTNDIQNFIPQYYITQTKEGQEVYLFNFKN